MSNEVLPNIGFILAATALIAVAIKSIKKQKAKEEIKEIHLFSSRLRSILDEIRKVPELSHALSKYTVLLKAGSNMVFQGRKAYGVAMWGRREIWLDFNFVETAYPDIILNVILHELGHLELGHTTYSPENEAAASEWQLAALRSISAA